MSNHAHASFIVLLRAAAGMATSIVGLFAVLGGTALIVQPSGRALGLDVSLLRGTPFHDFLVPGAILALIVGGTAIAAVLAQSRASAGLWTVGAGATLFWWMFVQVLLIGVHSRLQPTLFFSGFLIQLDGLLVHLLDGGRALTPATPSATAPASARLAGAA